MKWESAPPFEFEVNGKTYTVTPIGERGYTEYLNWQSIIAGEKDAPAPADEGAMLLQDAYGQMVADGVPAAAIRRAMLTVITDLRMNREAAEQVWERGLTPELLAPTMTSGADQAQGSTPSSSTGEASETQKPASTTTTSSRKRTKRGGKRRQVDTPSST